MVYYDFSVFADDVNVVGDTLEDIGNVSSLLETEAREVYRSMSIKLNK